LSALTRSLTASATSPLVRLFYWTTFLDLYLQSGVRSPVYLEDALPEIIALLDRTASDLVDPDLIAEIRRLSDSPLLPDTQLTRDFRGGVELAVGHRPFDGGPQEAPVRETEVSPELHARILLVPTGLELLGRRPELAIPAVLSIRASRGFRKPGEIVWRIQREDRDPIDTVAENALSAAWRQAGIQRPRLSYEIRLQRSDWHLRGSSLGLALATLFYTFEAAERRQSPRLLAPDVAVLGSIDEAGHAVPVAANTLPQKIRGAFGAGFRVVVIPSENLETAGREIDRLRGRYPQAKVPALAAVGSLGDLLARGDLFVEPVKPVRSLVERVRIRRIGVVVLLALVGLGCIFWFRPRAWLPETTEIVSNRDTTLVTVKLSGFPPRERQWHFDTWVAKATVLDLAPRSRAALFVGTNVDGPHPAYLYCYDLGTKHLLWERDLSDPLALPEPDRSTITMHVSEVVTTDLDGDGRSDVIATVLANPTSPCFVYWLRDDGTTRSIYAHRGYLFGLRVEDYEGDGHPEIFLAGTSNFDGHPLNQSATLVVLDRDHFSGWPDGGPFSGSSRAPFDSSRARVVFPPIPEHCQILKTPGYYVTSYVVHPSPADPFILVAIGGHSAPGLVVTLGRDFRPVRVVAEDNLGPFVQRALESHVIAEDFTTPERLDRYLHEAKRVR
jgi:hypothetical protein